MARWLETVRKCDFEIHHRAGGLHANTDTLSRQPCEERQCCQLVEDQGAATPGMAALWTISPGDDDTSLGSRDSSLQTAAASDNSGWEFIDPQKL